MVPRKVKPGQTSFYWSPGKFWVCGFTTGFFFVRRQNNSSSEITQAIFKITQGIFAQKLKLPEVFCLIQEQKVNKRGEITVFVLKKYWILHYFKKISQFLHQFYHFLLNIQSCTRIMKLLKVFPKNSRFWNNSSQFSENNSSYRRIFSQSTSRYVHKKKKKACSTTHGI